MIATPDESLYRTMRREGKKSIHRERILAYSTVGTPDYIAPEVLAQKVKRRTMCQDLSDTSLILQQLNLNSFRILMCDRATAWTVIGGALVSSCMRYARRVGKIL